MIYFTDDKENPQKLNNLSFVVCVCIVIII